MEKIKLFIVLSFGLINLGFGKNISPLNEISSLLFQKPLKLGDSVWGFDAGGQTGDFQCLGVEFNGNFFWVSGGNSGSNTKRLYKFDSEGVFVAFYNAPTLYRDLAWDGNYLWGASHNLYQIDPETGEWTGVTIDLQYPGHSVAYNPLNDHFYTAFYESPIYEWDRNGNLMATYPNDRIIVGLAWDNLSQGSPYLWVATLEDNGAGGYNVIYRYDLETETLREVFFPATAGDAEAFAGGICFTGEWNSSIGILFELEQAYPNDLVIGYYITELENSYKLKSSWDSEYLLQIPSSNGFNFFFSIPERSRVNFKIYDLRGRLVNLLFSGVMDTRVNLIEWNLKDKSGIRVPRGIYFLSIESDRFRISRKLIILK